ncbi:MAG TPA: Vms1/Ankzf1 family peptidyl-tRNA hydrolase [Blastocatellia bacterium]|nr:Vms1/Ankzf1 family peptidyl-tRNA hydrolase [Blastocatellia bacterium]
MNLEQLTEQLAAWEPTEFPFVSLYLNTQPNETGRGNYDSFLRKQFEEIAKTFPLRSPEQESFTQDTNRIQAYLESELPKSANGVAIFACSGADFFEAMPLEGGIDRHRVSVANYPDIYPLARLQDQYKKYAAVLLDSNSARIFVFGLGRQLAQEVIASPKTNRTQVGGWSQARYQRHTENIHLHHVKEVVETLERIVREEQIEDVLRAGDEVIIPVMREQMPSALKEKIVDVLRLDVNTPEHEVLQTTLERMREKDADDDVAKVERLLNEYRSGGLAVVGVEPTRAALEMGQVDELIISATRSEVKGEEVKDENGTRATETPTVLASAVESGTPEVESKAVAVTDELAIQAQRTAARIVFIEDPSLLAEVGGVGALLRFKL